jgi:anti-sigma regulatory factor (Ser/Thr protein kinase)
LVGGDPRFLEALERELRRAWPATPAQRVHPGGDLSLLKLALGAPGSLVVIDRRLPLKFELTRMLGKVAAAGGSVVAVAALPRKVTDLQEVALDDGFAHLSHNLAWESPLIGQAVVRARDTGGFGGLAAKADAVVAEGKDAVTDSVHKSRFVEALAARLGEAGVQRTRRSKIASVVDELLMNALYHAPKGHDRAAHALASWRLDDAGIFRATVADAFGSYAREEAHRKLVNFLANEMVEVTQTAGRGGGVGLFLVFKVSREYFLYVDPGRKTEITIEIDTQVKSALGLGTAADGQRAQREALVYYAPSRRGPIAP